nr:non-ribosomal peptide synthetase [Gordonia desulfuricans]
MSAAQSELWLAQQVHPTVPFAISQYFDLRGPVDLGLLEQCTRRAGHELESPHVRFTVVDGRPLQFVDHGIETAFDRIDLTGYPDPDRVAHRWMLEDTNRIIDLTGGDVSKVVLFVLGPDRYRCYGRAHHIAVDGYGAGRLLARGAELYSAAAEGRPAAPSGALSVARIVAAERRYRSSPRFADDREYWREHLADLTHVTSLGERHTAPSSNPHVVQETLDAPAVSRIEAVGRRSGAGMAEVLVAALAAFLAQMTGDGDVTVSLPVAGRITHALRRSAGMVSNVVPVRVRGVADSSIDDIVRRTRATLVGALRHQLYRHEDLLRDQGVGVAGRNGYGPLINVLTFPEHIGFGAARGRAHLLSAGPVDDLTINCYRFGDGPLNIDFFANPGRYGAEELRQYHRQFLDCLSRFLQASGEQRVLDAVTATRSIAAAQPLRSGRLLPDLLAAGVGSGARIAVRAQGRSLTYRELDQRTAQWARELIAHGAGPEVVVAVALPRSVESVMALWAVARTGAVFFPVDPSGPPARLQGLFANSQAAMGVTHQRWRSALDGTGVADWLVLDDEFTSAALTHPVTTVTDADRIRPLRAAHPAYLIYTSGSTGQPKGVLTTHEGLAALGDDLIARYRIDPTSVVPQTHSPYCDASMLEYLSAFASGGTLVIPEPEVVAGERLARVITDHAITHLMLTPAILATLDRDRLTSLQTVAVGGDACPPALADHWAARVAMFNSYGPTEATVVVTQTDRMVPGSAVSIGRPLPGVQLCVLDTRLRPVPRGARGELYLAGDATARAYLRQPAVTAQSFVANPHGPEGTRMYRTGDVVRERPDGTLQYLGRSDNQISLRGQRIEPAEVERALADDDAVVHAAVRIWSSETLGDRLIGYIVAADTATDRSAVVTRLRKALPAAMIPDALMIVPEIPINPSSGKTDRSKLPDPRTVARPEFREPRTTVEHSVALAISEVTGQSDVGLDDNFFELGGNSLLAVDLCRRLSEETGADVTMSMLFTPTVQTMSTAIDRATAASRAADTRGAGDLGTGDLGAGSHGAGATDDHGSEVDLALATILPLRATGVGTPLVCLHSAVPLAWCYTGLLPYIGNRPIYGVQTPAIATGSEFGHTVDELVEMYRRELTRVLPRGPVHLLGWSLGGQLAHALAEGLHADGHPVDLVVMLDSVAFAEGVSPPPEPPTMRDLVTHLEGNESETPDTRPLTVDGAVATLAQSSGPGRGLTRTQLERLHRAYVACVMMSASYRPSPVDADLLYFSTRRGITAGLTGEMWQPHFSGHIIEHDVDVSHAQMTNPEALAVIGPILDGELRRRH